MGEVKKERILEILDGYDKENITIAIKKTSLSQL